MSPEPLTTIDAYERACRSRIPGPAFEFLYGTRDSPHWSTHTANLDAFDAIKLRPRVLTGVSEPRLGTTLLGTPLSMPIVVGPTGVVPGPGGEVEIAAATKAAGTLIVLSSMPIAAAADVARAAGAWWQQVFLYRKREITEWQVRQAVGLGAGAIVVTVSNTGAPYYREQNAVSWTTDDVPPAEPMRRFPRELHGDGVDFDPAVSWTDLAWLRSLSDLPLVVKGIQTAEDARLCLDHGVDGIVVSNHGGRYAQGVRGTMEALPEVVEAVGGRIPVSIDGGVRHGHDVLKALALGAATAWIGRASLWGLTVGGQAGVEGVLGILDDELRSTMALCGVPDVAAVDPALAA
jgi:isopentenyl diphosphate isomerase/L-lactate dehydrogenase-like FMN-dependent dehydrogenase